MTRAMMQPKTDRVTLKDNYSWYKKNYEKPVTRSTYNKIITALNSEVIDYLLLGEGRKFYFGSRLGYLTIFKFKRNIRIAANGKLIAPADWGKTNKLKKEGKLDKGKVVYITDDYYIGFKWVREHCNIKGNHAYKFRSSRTNGYSSKTGANNRLREKLKEPLYHFKFPFIR